MASGSQWLDRSFSCHAHLDVGARGVRLEFVGDLDSFTVPHAQDALYDAAAQDDLRLVVIDLRGLTFIDSSGLRLLRHAKTRLDQAGLRLAIAHGEETIRRLCQITGADAPSVLDGVLATTMNVDAHTAALAADTPRADRMA